jgi:hypothetical protein
MVYTEKYFENWQLVSTFTYITNRRIIEGSGRLKWMFLTSGDVMVNGLFISVEGLSLGVEAVGILVDADIC